MQVPSSLSSFRIRLVPLVAGSRVFCLSFACRLALHRRNYQAHACFVLARFPYFVVISSTSVLIMYCDDIAVYCL